MTTLSAAVWEEARIACLLVAARAARTDNADQRAIAEVLAARIERIENPYARD
jgi:hypothetical protein